MGKPRLDRSRSRRRGDAPDETAAEEAADRPSPSDEELMASVRADGDRQAFATLYERHRRAIYGLCRTLIADRERAEDAFTETFLNVLRKAHTYRVGRPFLPWLYQIARNYCLNLRRQEGRRKALSLDASAGPAADSGEGATLGAVLDGGATDPGEAACAAEATARVRAAIARLPEPMQEIIILRNFQGLSCKEIAEVLGCPVGTVWSRLHNALDRLREELVGTTKRNGDERE